MSHKKLTKHLIATGKRIKEVRIETGYTQRELSEYSGIYRGDISKIESGQTNITLGTLSKIAEALDVTLADIIR